MVLTGSVTCTEDCSGLSLSKDSFPETSEIYAVGLEKPKWFQAITTEVCCGSRLYSVAAACDTGIYKASRESNAVFFRVFTQKSS